MVSHTSHLLLAVFLILGLLSETYAVNRDFLMAPSMEDEAISLSTLEESFSSNLDDAPETIVPVAQENKPEQAKTGRFPYMVSIRSLSGNHHCNGALVSPSIVVTVAQCVDVRLLPNALENPTVWVGADSNEEPTLNRTVIRQVEKTQLHPTWTGNPWQGFDIAVLYLDMPVENLHPIRLLHPAISLSDSSPLSVMGFGRLSASSANSPVLQIGRIKYVAQETCKGYYENSFIAEDKVCAGLTAVATCQGDLGAPLILENQYKNDILVGLTSIIHQDCSTFPGPLIFSGVTAYWDFIWDAINDADP